MEFAARITGTGSAFPEKRLTNDDIARELTRVGLETGDRWIRERTGIVERRISNLDNKTENNSSRVIPSSFLLPVPAPPKGYS